MRWSSLAPDSEPAIVVLNVELRPVQKHCMEIALFREWTMIVVVAP